MRQDARAEERAKDYCKAKEAEERRGFPSLPLKMTHSEKPVDGEAGLWEERMELVEAARQVVQEKLCLFSDSAMEKLEQLEHYCKLGGPAVQKKLEKLEKHYMLEWPAAAQVYGQTRALNELIETIELEERDEALK
ncbi:hypothetical protein CDD83_5837 [Cordyceps sp. RAO-2017]|nr:hypothetical protein CDD83_5837 [Cordyceps sp. RAO-2017]